STQRGLAVKRFLRTWMLLFVAALSMVEAPHARANVKLPAVIGSHMVLQRERPVPIWGWADPGEEITVTFGGKSTGTKADDKGRWQVTLEPIKANGASHAMTIAGKNRITLDDILIGEVWLGSGQSNMEWPLSRSHDAESAIPAADQPMIRLLQVPKVQ